MGKVRHFFEFFRGEGGEEGTASRGVEIFTGGDRTITFRRETVYMALIFFVAVSVGAFLLGRMTAPKAGEVNKSFGFACGIWRDIKSAREALALLRKGGIEGAEIGRVKEGYCVVVRGYGDIESAKDGAEKAIRLLMRKWTKGLRSWFIGAE